MINFSRLQHIIWQIALLAIILGNSTWLHWPVLGTLFGIVFLWYNSKKISDIFFPKIHKGLKNILGLTTLLTYISLNYTIFYHAWEINFWTFLWVLVSISILVEFLSYKSYTNHYFLQDTNFGFFGTNNIRSKFLPAIVFLLDLFLFFVLFRKSYTGIIRSPWEILNYKFWALFMLSNILITINFINRRTLKNIFLIAWHFLLISSIGIILYQIGYGYDSFIHQAALQTIKETGTIQPRLFLYIGQYGLTFFLTSISQLSLATINKILLPVSFALIWPTSLYYGLRYGFNWSRKISYLAVLWSIFVGINFAIMTTPQSFSYLLLAMIFFLMPDINNRNISWQFIWLVAIMTMTIHPLAGIPLLCLASLMTVWQMRDHPKLRKILFYLLSTITALVLPLFLAFYQRIQGIAWSEIFSFKIWPIISLPNINWYQTFSFPLDFAHNIGSNQIWLYILATLFGLWIIFRENKYIFFKRITFFTILLIINFLLTKIFLNFNLQITYQKDDYSNRILFMIAIGALPIFLTAVYYWFREIFRSNGFWNKTWLVILTSIIIGISTYFTYPIYDQHGNSKSFNITATDIKTVQTIKNDAGDQPYIVLANQMVGAASIKNYGFAHYYNDNFYYSMPLGTASIYDQYLNMIEKNASREEALMAMDKAGVDRLYFVVNNYWHTAKQAIAQAEISADNKMLIDDGVNTVFVYYR